MRKVLCPVLSLVLVGAIGFVIWLSADGAADYFGASSGLPRPAPLATVVPSSDAASFTDPHANSMATAMARITATASAR